MAEKITTLAEVDAVLKKQAVNFTDDVKNSAIDVASVAFETECGVAFTSRSAEETVSGTGTQLLALPDPMVSAVSAVTDRGASLGISTIRINEKGGVIVRDEGWPFGYANLVVSYTHGYAEVPEDVSRAVALIASAIVADGPWDDRGYGVTEGGGMVRLLTAGVSGAAFSIPEVQATLIRRRVPRIR